MTDVNDTGATLRGPGKRLYEARVQARLSPEQVAELLHLSPEQIVALENDDFDKLPGPTYVRGYLRSYCQLLGLPAREIVESYAKVNGASKSASIGQLAPLREPTTRDAPVRFAAFLVLGILILLAVVWWQGRSQAPAPALSPAAVPQVQEPPPVSMPEPERTAAAAPAVQDEVVPEPITPVPGDDSGEVAPPEELSSEPPAEEVTAAEPPGLDETALVVRTSEECWVDIRDGRGEKLLYALVPAGRRITLTGTPPFAVFLGNPDGVTLQYKDESIDASRYKRGLVARFTVGSPEAAAN